MSLKLVDCSTYQGKPNYFAVKEAGFDGALVRVSYGEDYDIQYQYNREEIRKVNTQGGGFLRGYYHEGQGGDPVKEAEYFISYIDDLQEGEVIALIWGDYPYNGDYGQWVRTFFDTVRKKYSTGLLLYSNRDTLSNHNLNASLINLQIPLWLSTLQDSPLYQDTHEYNSYTITMEQYSEKGTVDGIPGNVDLNLFYGSIDDWNKIAYRNPLTVPPIQIPIPTPSLPYPIPEKIYTQLDLDNAVNTAIQPFKAQIEIYKNYENSLLYKLYLLIVNAHGQGKSSPTKSSP